MLNSFQYHNKEPPNYGLYRWLYKPLYPYFLRDLFTITVVISINYTHFILSWTKYHSAWAMIINIYPCPYMGVFFSKFGVLVSAWECLALLSKQWAKPALPYPHIWGVPFLYTSPNLRLVSVILKI